ncbi:MAG: chorismate mutase, partial [Desulfovibrionaceae bacterium]|nr:chorismate mutase [Desulfovibrionaceae bacterium]
MKCCVGRIRPDGTSACASAKISGRYSVSSSKETAESVHWPERLRQIRGEIDAVDGKLLELLNRRAALSLEVGRIKSDDPGIVFKPLREREVRVGETVGAVFLQNAETIRLTAPDGT